MKIGIIIGRIGGEDGVSLETEKWIYILKKLKHEVYIISGEFERKVLPSKYQTLAPELSFFSKRNQHIQKKAFLKPSEDKKKVVMHINSHCDIVSNSLVKWINKNKLDLIISENASALPYHLTLGVGIKRAVERTGIKAIAHDHDFYWERGDRYVSPFNEINNVISDSFPLRGKSVKHVVINTKAKTELKKRFGINATVIPNVMDYDQKTFGQKNKFNSTLLKDLGLKKNDIPLFQITRIVKRKKIETAVELIEKIGDKKIKLIITGGQKDDPSYYKTLKKFIKEKKLSNQVIFAGELFDSCHDFLNNKNICKIKLGKKYYSISDAYAHSRACTFFSVYEGFGNAFIEAVLAKRPIFVNNYSVYWQDIGSKGFIVPKTNQSRITQKVLEEIKKIIYDEKHRKKVVEHNYKLGKKYFSYQVLQKSLKKLLK